MTWSDDHGANTNHDKDEPNRRQRVTTMDIPRFTSNLEVKRHDLYLPSEQDEYRKYPNYDSSLASIRLPSNVYWGRMLFGQFDKLFIVSPETTPDNSEAGSMDSRFNSPNSTFDISSSQESARDAHGGAHRE